MRCGCHEIVYTPGIVAAVAEPVSVAILGLGRMGRLHARVIASGVPDLRVAALADLLPGRPAEVGRETGLDAARYLDPEAALAHPGLEACVVAAPTGQHQYIVRGVLQRGLHVFCEKPLGLDADEDERLGAKADTAGLTLQVGFWRRYSPPWVVARRVLRDGVIGRPLFLRMSQWDASLPPPAFHDLRVSGGIIVDCGIHEFDLVEWLTGQRIVRVEGYPLPLVHPELAETGDLDNTFVVAHLAGGQVAAIDLSRNAGYADDIRSEILGSAGAVFVATVPSGRAWVGTTEGVRELEDAAVPDAIWSGVSGELTAFAAAVRGSGDEVPGARESARALRIAQAAVRATVSGRPEPVPDRG